MMERNGCEQKLARLLLHETALLINFMRYNESSCLRNSNSLNLAVQHLREKLLQERALFLSTLWVTLSRDISQLSSELIPPLQRQVNVSKKQAMFKKLNSLWKWKMILASTVNTTAYCICFSSLTIFLPSKTSRL